MDAVIDPRRPSAATANILKTLSPKEEKVIRPTFDIGCEHEHTLEEIGPAEAEWKPNAEGT